MEAKDLRIGNWVMSLINGESQINAKGILWQSENKGYYDPIPLTEEWLIKFGFDEITPKYYVLNIDENTSFTYYYTFSGGVWHFEFEGISIKIKYVHQLQNLYFALTGEELTIINK
jgi:hypothetical protein